MSVTVQERSLRLRHKISKNDDHNDHAFVLISDDDYVSIPRGLTMSAGNDLDLPKYDPLESRRRSWKAMFGSEPMPPINPNAAYEYAGSLNDGMSLSDADVEELFYRLDNE